jgi:hypothetical protein
VRPRNRGLPATTPRGSENGRESVPGSSLRVAAQYGVGRLQRLAFNDLQQYTEWMATITEVERLAFDLPEAQRAVLAAHLLDSLSPVLRDEDDGLQEALIRDRELDSNPSSALSLEQLDHQIRSRRSS